MHPIQPFCVHCQEAPTVFMGSLCDECLYHLTEMARDDIAAHGIHQPLFERGRIYTPGILVSYKGRVFMSLHTTMDTAPLVPHREKGDLGPSKHWMEITHITHDPAFNPPP